MVSQYWKERIEREYKEKMEKPMKCKCGKMINRPSANKSGLCSSCSIDKFNKGKVKDE